MVIETCKCEDFDVFSRPISVVSVGMCMEDGKCDGFGFLRNSAPVLLGMVKGKGKDYFCIVPLN